jgi:membrane protease YdiL (CAAX protease family)
MLDMRNRTVIYFAIAFLVTWCLWLIPVLATRGVLAVSPAVRIGCLFAGSFGPFIGAFVNVYFEGGWQAVLAFAARSLRFRIPPVVLAAALLLVPMAGFIAALLHAHETGQAFAFATTISALPMLFVMLFFIGGSVNEEFGWAYAIDGMQQKWGLLPATLLLGVIWGFWHLPLFFIAGMSQSFMPFWAFLILTVSLRTLYVWAYESSGKSILATLVFHTAANMAFNLYTLIDHTPKNDQSTFVYFAFLTAACATVVALSARCYRSTT